MRPRTRRRSQTHFARDWILSRQLERITRSIGTPVLGGNRVEMLPGGHGDALLVEYGTTSKKHRILIDAGTQPSYPHVKARLLDVPDGGLDLLVVTHVDTDHIAGVLPLLAAIALAFVPRSYRVLSNNVRISVQYCQICANQGALQVNHSFIYPTVATACR